MAIVKSSRGNADLNSRSSAEVTPREKFKANQVEERYHSSSSSSTSSSTSPSSGGSSSNGSSIGSSSSGSSSGNGSSGGSYSGSGSSGRGSSGSGSSSGSTSSSKKNTVSSGSTLNSNITSAKTVTASSGSTLNSNITSAGVVTAVSSSIPVVTNVKDAFANINLTVNQITSWKNKIDTTISKNLVASLKKASEDATQLYKVTASGQDSDNLNYRFRDLQKVTSQAAQKLTIFMKSFDESLTTYIGTIDKAEKTTSDKLKKSIDQFAEAASKISAL